MSNHEIAALDTQAKALILRRKRMAQLQIEHPDIAATVQPDRRIFLGVWPDAEEGTLEPAPPGSGRKLARIAKQEALDIGLEVDELGICMAQLLDQLSGGPADASRPSVEALTSECTGYTLLFVYHGEHRMQVSKWGNSLAIRIPAAVVEALELKEGDEVLVHVLDDRVFAVERDRSRERALERIRKLQKSLPPDWKFDREDANAR